MLKRIDAIAPETRPLWGKMNPAQMMAHVRRGIQLASGEVISKRTFIGFLFGRIARQSIITDKPWKPNLPTAKEFIVSDQRDFVTEKRELIESIGRFSDGGTTKATTGPHPFFGYLTPEEWERLMWKHLDHHLRQFGV